jgi:hypothetical protein
LKNLDKYDEDEFEGLETLKAQQKGSQPTNDEGAKKEPSRPPPRAFVKKVFA